MVGSKKIEINNNLYGEVEVFGCAIIQDRAEQVFPNVKQLLPFVDKMILIDGGSNIKMIEELKSLSNKIFIVDYKWRDNFPLSRQQYLDAVGALKKANTDAWILRFDSDEFISVPFLSKLDVLLKYCYQNNYNAMGIRCREVEVDVNGNELTSQISDDWKLLVYKWFSDLKYIANGSGLVHEAYNINFNVLKVPSKSERGRDGELCFLHLKSKGDVWMRAAFRNLVIGGGGPNLGEKQKLWKPYLELIHKYVENYNTYHDYISYLIKGNVAKELKDWFITHMFEGFEDKPQAWKDYCIINGVVKENYDFISDTEKSLGFNYDGMTEVREGYLAYFRWLHPEEEPEELKNFLLNHIIF
jgi:hypothetical protein